MPADLRQLAITSDGNHAAVIGLGGSRPAVFVDGNAGPPYSAISPWASLEPGKPPPGFLGWSADNTVLAYVASKGAQFTLVQNQREGPSFDAITGVAFSTVGHRVIYVARQGVQSTATNPMQFFVVVDGKPGPSYRSVQAVQLSADGRHVGYVAQTRDGALPNHVVIDGQEGPGFANIADLRLSPSGGHSAYVAHTLRTNKIDKSVIVDGAQGPVYDEVRGLIFSNDGSHVAYFAAKANTDQSTPIWRAIVDGRAGPEFYDIPVRGVVFSPDGRRTAYAGKNVVGTRARAFAVIDGNKSLDYDECSDFIFSPDGQHVAHIATNNGKSVVVLDGKESDAHQSIDRLSLRFSADGSRFGFVAQDQSTWRVVVDGRAGVPRRDVIDGKSFEFSPDGQHHRFKHRTYSGDWNIVVDDRVDDQSPAVAKMAMTSDWRHTASIMRLSTGGSSSSFTVLLDGKSIGSDYAAADLIEISPDGRRVACVISKRGESGKYASHVVVDGRESPGYFRVTKLLFSSDSQHSAYVAWADGSKQFVVIDGFTGPVFDAILGSPNEQPSAIQFRPDGSLDYYAIKDGKLTHVMFDAATIAALPKPAADGTPASGYAEIYAFGSVAKDGAKPCVLTVAPDGTLFGATSAGGQYHNGVIFKMRPDGSNYTILRQILGGQNDGAYPSTLLVGRDGALYGTFLVQGPSGSGSVFRCAADGSDFKILHATQRDVDSPDPKLVSVDADGNIYGLSGRTSNNIPTHLFRMTPAGEFTRVLDTPFNQGDYNGLGPLVDGRDGYFYGVFSRKIFKLKQDGTGYTTIHTFTGPPLDTWGADRAPIVGNDGRLYGVSSGGGQSGGGIVYSVGRDGSAYKLIVDPESERISPRALVEGPDGKLYALVAKGVARFNKDGSDYAIIHAADGGSFADAAFVKDNVFYAMKYAGGKGSGVVFRYGLAEATTSAAPVIAIKEVAAAPLPAPVAEMGEVEAMQIPIAADGGGKTLAAAAGASAPAVGAAAPPPTPDATVSANPSQPVPHASPASAQPPNQAPGAPASVGSAPPNDTVGSALKDAEAQADAALNKAKEKAGQAANKAKGWMDSVFKKKKN